MTLVGALSCPVYEQITLNFSFLLTYFFLLVKTVRYTSTILPLEISFALIKFAFSPSSWAFCIGGNTLSFIVHFDMSSTIFKCYESPVSFFLASLRKEFRSSVESISRSPDLSIGCAISVSRIIVLTSPSTVLHSTKLSASRCTYVSGTADVGRSENYKRGFHNFECTFLPR